MQQIAKGTPGFSGADLQNLVNQVRNTYISFNLLIYHHYPDILHEWYHLYTISFLSDLDGWPLIWCIWSYKDTYFISAIPKLLCSNCSCSFTLCRLCTALNVMWIIEQICIHPIRLEFSTTTSIFCLHSVIFLIQIFHINTSLIIISTIIWRCHFIDNYWWYSMYITS